MRTAVEKDETRYLQIGARLKEIREGMGLTREKAAEFLGKSEATIARLETGSPITCENLIALHDKLGVDPTYLLLGVKREEIDPDSYLTNCTKEERHRFMERMMVYVEKLL